MQTQHSEHATDGPTSTLTPGSGRPSSHTHYLMIMRSGMAPGGLAALMPPPIPSELRGSVTRERARRWAARRIGWLR